MRLTPEDACNYVVYNCLRLRNKIWVNFSLLAQTIIVICSTEKSTLMFTQQNSHSIQTLLASPLKRLYRISWYAVASLLVTIIKIKDRRFQNADKCVKNFKSMKTDLHDSLRSVFLIRHALTASTFEV